MSAFDLNELSTGGNAWSPEEIGDTLTGVITNIERRQQKAFDGSGLLTWDDGTPRLLTVVTLQTDLNEKDDDTGIREVYLKGGSKFEPAKGKGTSGEVAFKDAANKAGLKSIELDGSVKMTIIHSGLAKKTQGNYLPAKLYQVKLEQVTPNVDVDDFFDD